MQFLQKLILKKDWIRGNNKIDFTKGAEFVVVNYDHKYGVSLHHDRVNGIMEFPWHYSDREQKIEEYFEIVKDAENEKYEHEIKLKFGKTGAAITFENKITDSEFAHGIALLILALNDNQEEPDLHLVMGGVLDAIHNIKGKKK